MPWRKYTEAEATEARESLGRFNRAASAREQAHAQGINDPALDEAERAAAIDHHSLCVRINAAADKRARLEQRRERRRGRRVR